MSQPSYPNPKSPSCRQEQAIWPRTRMLPIWWRENTSWLLLFFEHIVLNDSTLRVNTKLPVKLKPKPSKYPPKNCTVTLRWCDLALGATDRYHSWSLISHSHYLPLFQISTRDCSPPLSRVAPVPVPVPVSVPVPPAGRAPSQLAPAPPAHANSAQGL